MLRFFLQPYPISDNIQARWLTAAGSAVFVGLFLYLFRPFGINEVPGNDVAVLVSGYALVTFLALLLNFFVVPALLPKIFTEERWTVLYQFLYVLGIILTIALANTVYSGIVFDFKISAGHFLYFILVTFLISVFPVSFSILINQNRLLRKNQQQAEHLSGRIRRYKKLDMGILSSVRLKGDNHDELLEVPSKDILFLNAADNYCTVAYLENGQLKKKMLRITLKNARTQLKDHSSFYRCHRSWIVNLDHVLSVKGNAQGYRLVLDESETEIPVSRTLNAELDSRLAK